MFVKAEVDVQDVRLLYAGGQLSDQDCLSDCLHISQQLHTIHPSCSVETSQALQDHQGHQEEELAEDVEVSENTDNDQVEVRCEVVIVLQSCYVQTTVMWEIYYQYLYLQYLHSLAQHQQDHLQPLQDHQDLQANQHQQPPDQVADRDREERGEEDNGDGGEDLLDWLYQSSRVAIFLGIVYYYSSLERVLIVLGIAGLIYLHQVRQN